MPETAYGWRDLGRMPLVDALVHLRSGKLARVRPTISAEADAPALAPGFGDGRSGYLTAGDVGGRCSGRGETSRPTARDALFSGLVRFTQSN